MPVYTAKFPASAAGRQVIIKDQAGTTLATQTLPAASGGRVRDSFTHDGTQEDEFTGTVQIPTGGQLQAQYTLDTPASIASGGGVGASETAYFVATGPVFATDGGGAANPLVIEDDDSRHDNSAVAWVSVVDGALVFTDDAGTVAWSLNGVFDFDFSATTPQGSGGNLTNSIAYIIDGGSEVVAPNIAKPGDGTDAQTSTPSKVGEVGAMGSLSLTAYPSADDVTDGAATPRVALTVTRIAQAAVLPA